ncbi:MAG: SRPBCC family protein [Anaerolineae bacterium]|nr:SRPBCC family protein [Anaerolineae bacterium]
MENYQLTRPPIAKAEMLIRKPVAEVFEAFIDPTITAKFWFTKGSDRLEPGKQVRWEWEMYNASAQVEVKAVEPNKRILIEWSGYGGLTTVEWIFTPLTADTTFVTITEAGFSGGGDEVVKQALDSTGGFTWVLAGLKALLEHNIILNLVADRFPEGLEKDSFRCWASRKEKQYNDR